MIFPPPSPAITPSFIAGTSTGSSVTILQYVHFSPFVYPTLSVVGRITGVSTKL